MSVIPYTHLPHTTRNRARGVPFGSSVEQLVADTFDSLWGRTAQTGAARTPPMDVSETDSAYHLAFELPGVRKDQLKVSIEGRRVSIETIAAADAVAEPANDTPSAAATSVPAQAQVQAPRKLYTECRAAHFARTVSLPSEVDQTSSQARFENGVLTLVLAKRVPTGATQLSID